MTNNGLGRVKDSKCSINENKKGVPRGLPSIFMDIELISRNESFRQRV